MWSRYAERHAAFLYRRHRAVIFAGLLLTLVAGYFVSKLRIDSDLGALLPEDYPSVQTLEQIRARLGGVGNLRVVVTSDHPERARAFVEDLVAALNRSPLIHFVDYRVDREFFRKHSLLYMSLEDLETVRDRIEERIAQEKIKLSPFYVSLDDGEAEGDSLDLSDIERKYEGRARKDAYFSSEDGRTLAVEVYPSGSSNNLAFVREVLGEVKGIVARLGPGRYDPGMVVEYSGQFQNRVDEYDILIDDVFGTLLYGLVAVMLLVTVYFRQPMTAFFLGVPLLMGLIWTFGIAYGAIGNLNVITAFLFVVLFGLSIEFGVHLLYRYLEGRRAGAGVEESLKLIVARTGQAMLTSGATTAVAFFSLMITDFKGFSEFGFIMGLGYLLCLAAMLTVFPAFLVVSERWRLLRGVRGGASGGRGAASGPMPMARGILGVGVVLTIGSILLIPRLEFEYDFRKLRAYVPETERAREKVGPIFSLSQSPAVVLADSKEDLDAVVSVVLERMRLDTLTATIDTVKTIYSALPADQEGKYLVIQDLKDLLREENVKLLNERQRAQVDSLRDLLDVRPIQIQDLPYNVRRNFTGADGRVGNFVFIYPGVSLAEGRNAIRFAEDVRDIPIPSGRVYHASSGQVVFADVLLVMMRDSRVAVLATLLVVFLIVLADFRSLRAALLVLLPLLVGILWMCGGMAVLGMKLNLFNMVVFPALIGLSLDSGVHLYHRYREEGVGGLRRVVMTTGQAVAVGAFTTMLGFGDLILARHPGLQSLGGLALLGLATTLVTALVLFPAALQVAEDFSARRPSPGSEADAEAAGE
jgi:predicted RND superfamily exporter protein